jgi:Cu-Zn family superoxide dismutase
VPDKLESVVPVRAERTERRQYAGSNTFASLGFDENSLTERKERMSKFAPLASLASTVALGVMAMIGSAGAQTEGEAPEKPAIPSKAVAVMIPTAGNEVHGIVMFEQQGEAVRVRGKITNLSPGEHGFHIHEFGDLSKADGTSAGGHYNPKGTAHGGPGSEEHHVGDLGNITAGEDGVASFDHTFKFLQLHHIIGRSVVVHAGKDDLESQPSGDAGPRVGVGVIGIAHTGGK